MDEKDTVGRWMRDIIEKNLDKLFLLAAFTGMLVFIFHALHDTSDKDALSWMRELAGQFAAAFLTLVTSQYISNRKNGNGTPPPPPGPGAVNAGQSGATQPTAKAEAPPQG